ncbi:MAG: hypothetical protein B7C24_01010 [Bacteroidetes bacterium 4572_77]|nr:MAG: hypothetical protein B7C24_01010 [Bacteroidetes bacterium 4572_77]
MIRLFRNTVLLFLIIVSGQICWAQNASIDSLRTQLTLLNKAGKIPVLLEIAEQLKPSNLSMSIKFANEALEIAKDEQYLLQIANCHKQLGNYYYELGKNSFARHHFGNALSIYNLEGTTDDLCAIFLNIGNIYSREGFLDSATYFFEYAKNRSYKYQDTLWLARSIRALGNTNYKKGDYEKTLSDYHLALSLCSDNQKYTHEKSSIYNNLGVLFSDWGKYNKSLSFYHQSLALLDSSLYQSDIGRTYNNMGNIYWYKGIMDSALLFYKKSLRIREANKDNYGMANIMNNLGMYYGSLEIYDKSLLYFNLSLKKFEQLNNRRGKTMTLYNIGSVYFETPDYTLAKKYFSQSLRIARAQGFASYIRDNLESLKEIYVQQNEWQKAYKALSSYKIIRDSSRREQNFELLAEMETNFEKERKQASLNILQNEMNAAEVQQSQTKLSLWGVGIILILILFTTYLILRHIRNEANDKQDAITPTLLRYQLNPQFINSSLNGVKELIKRDQIKESSMFLAGFSRIIRSFIETATSNVIILDKELQVTKNFFKLHQLRYPDRLKITYNIATYVETEMLAVPPFLVFPAYVYIIDNYMYRDPISIDVEIDIRKNNLSIVSNFNYQIEEHEATKDTQALYEIISHIQERMTTLNKVLKEKLSIKYKESLERNAQKSISIILSLPIKPL